MKKKRPSVKKLPSGRWNCQVRVGDKRISVTDDDKDVCQAKAMAIQAGVIPEDEKKPKAITLEAAIDEYIASKSNTLSPSTIRGYDQVKRLRFKGIMKRDIYKLTKKDIQIAVNQESKLVAPKTVSNAYGLVRPVLKDYGIDVFGVKLPQRVKPDKEYIQPEEIGTLLEAAEKDPYEVPILLALWLGMRRSEICGLCWDCVDVEGKKIKVRRKLVMDKENHFNLVEGAKNISSQRTIDCPEYIMDKLSRLRGPKSEGRIFMMNPNTLLQHIHKICRETGITDSTTHGLRHTNAAVMRHLGVSDAYAMERGGWTEEKTYKGIYSYVFDSRSKEEVGMIDSFFSSKKKSRSLHTESALRDTIEAFYVSLIDPIENCVCETRSAEKVI